MTAVLIAVSLAPAGCGFMPAETPNLDGTGWRAVLVAGNQPVVGSEPTLRFDGGTISGTAGCNRFGGQATIQNGKLTVKEMLITLADCPEPAASTGRVVMAALDSGTLRIEEGLLVLSGARGEVVFRRDDTVR